ncbi:MAG: response regulator [Candidatus Aegiribacteria sp.]
MMEDKRILIIDDEKNIRLTLSHAIEPMGFSVDSAVNGEEGLEKIAENDYDIILLDLKMPGMDGLEVLRRLREISEGVRVIIITAYGTIENAVEAMKQGAVDYIQKPFSPKEIRDIISDIAGRESLSEKDAESYDDLIQLGKKAVTDRDFPRAMEIIGRAIAKDPTKAEALNLLGVLFEFQGKKAEARKQYLAATDIDPTYKPAQKNLDRITGSSSQSGLDW